MDGYDKEQMKEIEERRDAYRIKEEPRVLVSKDALQRLIDYNEYEEGKDYGHRLANGEDVKGHIFEDITSLQEDIMNQPKKEGE